MLWYIDRTLIGNTSLGQHGTKINGNEEYSTIPRSPELKLHSLVSYPEHLILEMCLTPQQENQSAYSKYSQQGSVNWATLYSTVVLW